MKSKYMKGPWKHAGTFIQSETTGVCICERVCPTGLGDNEFVANAKLISACPELVEALEKCFVVIGGMGGNSDWSPHRELWLETRTALKKAGVVG